MARRVILIVLLLTGILMAEPVHFSLQQARERAAEQSPTLARLAARLEEVSQKVAEVDAGGKPHLDLEARYAFITPELAFSSPGGNLPIVVNNNYQAGLILEQAIATFGRLHWGRQAANLQISAVEQELVRAREHLLFEVSVAYSRLQSARRSIEVAEMSLAARDRFLKDLVLREREGTSARFEILVAEVAQAQDQQGLVLAQQQARLAQTRLQVLLGLAPDQTVETEPIPEELEEQFPETGEAIQKAMEQRAELRSMDFAIQAAEAKVKLEESESAPTLGLQTRYDQRTSTAFQTSNQWSVGVEFRWRLFDGGLSQARAAQADAVRVQLSESRRELERKVRLEVEEALVRCQTALQNLIVSRRNLLSATEAARLGELRFKMDVGTHQEVLDVQARLREAQQAVFDSEQGVLEARWGLQLALGTPVETEVEPGEVQLSTR